MGFRLGGELSDTGLVRDSDIRYLCDVTIPRGGRMDHRPAGGVTKESRSLGSDSLFPNVAIMKDGEKHGRNSFSEDPDRKKKSFRKKYVPLGSVGSIVWRKAASSPVQKKQENKRLKRTPFVLSMKGIVLGESSGRRAAATRCKTSSESDGGGKYVDTRSNPIHFFARPLDVLTVPIF